MVYLTSSAYFECAQIAWAYSLRRIRDGVSVARGILQRMARSRVAGGQMTSPLARRESACPRRWISPLRFGRFADGDLADLVDRASDDVTTKIVDPPHPPASARPGSRPNGTRYLIERSRPPVGLTGDPKILPRHSSPVHQGLVSFGCVSGIADV